MRRDGTIGGTSDLRSSSRECDSCKALPRNNLGQVINTFMLCLCHQAVGTGLRVVMPCGSESNARLPGGICHGNVPLDLRFSHLRAD